MAFLVAHGQKMKQGNLAGIRLHNERLTKNHSNEDIDPKRSKNNISWVLENGTYQTRVEALLTNQKKKPRSDAVWTQEFVITSDHKFMDSLSAADKKRFYKTAIGYFSDKCGQENIIYAEQHEDEITSHMHLGIAPVVEGRLCAKQMFNRQFFSDMQKELPERLQAAGFDIQRGRKGGKGHHLTKAEWQVEKQAAGASGKAEAKDLIRDSLIMHRKAKNTLREAQETLETARKDAGDLMEATNLKAAEIVREASRQAEYIKSERQKLDEEREKADKERKKKFEDGYNKGIMAGLKRAGSIVLKTVNNNDYLREVFLKETMGTNYEFMFSYSDSHAEKQAVGKARVRRIVNKRITNAKRPDPPQDDGPEL